MVWKGRRWEIMKPACDCALSSSSKSFEMARTTLILAHSLHLHRQGSVKHDCQAVPQRELVRKSCSFITFYFYVLSLEYPQVLSSSI